MTKPAPIGHNNPPEPVEEFAAGYEDLASENANWLDGAVVTNEGQMQDVDALIKETKSWKTAANKAKDDDVKPLYKAYKSRLDVWNVLVSDIDRQIKCLAGAVDPFKRKLAAEKEEARRKAWEEAKRKQREAEALADKAQATDLDAQRKADTAKQANIDAQKAASAAQKDTVKGLRLTWFYEVENMGALVQWIAKNDKPAMAEFAQEYARKHHQKTTMDGVRAWQEKVAK